MFLIFGTCFLILLSLTLLMLWTHEKIANKKIIPRAQVEECWTGEERREHSRFKQILEVEYNIEKRPHLKNGRTADISEGGMKLLLDEKLPKGTIMNLKVYIPERNKIIEVEGEIVWTKDANETDQSGKRFFHSGIKFIAINEPYDAHLSSYVCSLEPSKQEGQPG